MTKLADLTEEQKEAWRRMDSRERMAWRAKATTALGYSEPASVAEAIEYASFDKKLTGAP